MGCLGRQSTHIYGGVRVDGGLHELHVAVIDVDAPSLRATSMVDKKQAPHRGVGMASHVRESKHAPLAAHGERFVSSTSRANVSVKHQSKVSDCKHPNGAPMG